MRLGPFVTMHPIIPGLSDFDRLDRALFSAYPPELNPDRQIAYAAAALPTHPGVILVQCTAAVGFSTSTYAFLSKDVHYISGTQADIYALNAQIKPVLTDEDRIRTYLRLWLEIARGKKGWRLIEDVAAIDWVSPPSDDVVAIHAPLIHPLELGSPDSNGKRDVIAILQTTGSLISRRLMLWPSGLIHMKQDTALASLPALGAVEPYTPFLSMCGTPQAMRASPGSERAAVSLEGIIYRKDQDERDENQQSEKAEPEKEAPASAPAWDLGKIFQKVAETLLLRALTHTQIGKSDGDPIIAFFEYLINYRPMVAIETPYRELRNDLASYIADRTKLKLIVDGSQGNFTIWDGAAVILLTEALVPAEESTVDLVGKLEPVVKGPHIGLIIVERKHILPQDVRDMIDFSLKIPRMDDAAFWACSTAIFSAGITRTQAEWIRYVLPRDMARVAAATRDAGDYVLQLQATIVRRLAQYTMPEAPSLHDLQGLGEARYRIKELAADIRGAVNGTIRWDDVDRGYLLFGPPGTGKTTLIRALAKECGIRFILASAASWQERTSLGPHIQAIRNTFREARLYAPAILFIDEIDSLGSRMRTEEHNSQYQTVVINTVLEELQGFEGRDGVIVIGATNNLENIDEAIRRPGRLDRIVEVPYPNVAALASIYRYYLNRAARDGIACEHVDAQRLAQLSFGRTGSHVEVYVRSAIRQARRRGDGKIDEQDIVNEITARPPDGFGLAVSPEVMHRTAIHEAGHALIAMTGSDRNRDVPMVSIVPRANGSLGFMARAPSELGAVTYAAMEENIRIILAGRAAEEIVFGHDHVSSGSGGGAESDLALATQSVISLLTEFGFSEASGLLWIDWRSRGTTPQVTAEAIRNLPMGEKILDEARRTTDKLYAETLVRLREHRHWLDAIVAALIERQELSSDALKSLLKP